MNELPISDLLVATTSGGLSIGVGIYLARTLGRGVSWLLVFVTGRQDKRQATIDEAQSELIQTLRNDVAELRERVTGTERQLRECERKHAESEAKVMKLEALLAGLGDARQHAQLIVSEEKRRAAK